MSEQPRLLFCCFDVLPAPNGLSRRITEYLKGLADRFQVVVLSTKTPDHSHIERYHGARLLRVPVGGGDLQSRIQAFDRAVRRQLESEEYVIAHFFDPFGGYALCEARGQYGFRLVYDAQTFPSQELKYTHPSVEADRRFLSKVRRQELYCLMNADAVICGSEVTRDWVLSLGAPPMSLHVYHQPVDVAAYTKEAVGKPDGTPMKLLHLGSQLPYQGLSTLLRAMQLALRQADFRLAVVGPQVPEGQAPFDELVTELKLTGKVEFLPPVPHDELPKALANSDVGVLALDEHERNRGQGGPLAKVGEYLAAGRPVVAADLPVTRELVPEAARLLFPPGDFKALAEVLVKLANDGALRVKLGEAARAGAERFDASAVRGKLLDLYGLLSTRGKTAAPGEAQSSEVTELRKTGSSDTGTGRAKARLAEERPPGETIDEEEPVVPGQSLPAAKDDGNAAAVTDPGLGEARPPEPTPIVKSKKKKKGGTDEHTPIRPPPEAASEPTPITSARSRRVISKPGNKAAPPPPSPWPETPPSEPTPVAPPLELIAPSPAPPASSPPVRIRRTTEGKGVKSPVAPPPVAAADETPAVTAENPLPPPGDQGPPRIKRTSEGKGIRSPALPPAPAEPPPSVIVEMDAGLPKLNRAEEARAPAMTQQVPVLTPATDDLPRLARRPTEEQKSFRPTEEIPVLVPSPRVEPPSLASLPPPPLPPPPRSPAPPEEPDEISEDEIESVEEEAPRDTSGSLGPWLAQLLWGYCPPAATAFERPPPPTNFPGRET